jgi:HPt (histidine-containing phosphotransfer) domain-containing protein
LATLLLGQGAVGQRPSGSAVIDASVLAALRDLGGPDEPDALTEVVRLFLCDTPAQLSTIQTAFATVDAASVRTIAHQLRGSALALGANSMAAACFALEQGADRRPLGDLAPELDRLRREFELVRRELARAIR